jgi:hypothetical protein
MSELNEKKVKTRIVHKHDIAANWRQAVNFVPKQGELIIYDDRYTDRDGNERIVAEAVRYKIGDGVTKVNDLPFVSEAEHAALSDSLAVIGVDNKNITNATATAIGKGNITGVKGFYIKQVTSISSDSAKIELEPYKEILKKDLLETTDVGGEYSGLVVFPELVNERTPGTITLVTDAEDGDKVISVNKSYSQIPISFGSASRVLDVVLSPEIYNYKLLCPLAVGEIAFPYQAGDKLSIVYGPEAKRYDQVLTVTAITNDIGNGEFSVTVKGIPYPDESWNWDIEASKRGMYNHCVYCVNKPDIDGVVLSKYMSALGRDNKAMGHCSFTAGRENKTTCQYGTALGYRNEAGYAGLATGRGNKVLGEYSAAFGRDNTINEDSQWNITAGQNNIISGKARHSLVAGENNIVKSSWQNLVSGKENNVTGGQSSIIAGMWNGCKVDELNQHVEESLHCAPFASAVFGCGNYNPNDFAIVAGKNNSVSKYSATFGYSNTTAQDGNSGTRGWFSLISGKDNYNSGDFAIVVGESNHNHNSHGAIFGRSNTNSGDRTLITGDANTGISKNSLICGVGNSVETAEGGAVALGERNNITISHSIAIGTDNEVLTSPYGIAIGAENKVTNKYSIALGVCVQSTRNEQVVIGRFNDTNTASDALVAFGTGTSKIPKTGLYLTNSGTYSNAPIYENGTSLANKYAAKEFGLPTYNRETDEGKVLKIVNGVPTWTADVSETAETVQMNSH